MTRATYYALHRLLPWDGVVHLATSTKTHHVADEGGFVPRSGGAQWGGKWGRGQN